MNLRTVRRVSSVLGLSAVLMAGCAAHGTVTGPSGSATAASSSGLATEGTGPESPQSPGDGGGNEVAVFTPGMPIGANAQSFSGNYECVIVQWKGTIGHAGVVLTVTNVVLGGPFVPAGMAAAGCPQPACITFRFTAGDNGDADCYTGVEYTGPPADSDSPGVGSLGLDGQLTCPDVDSETCQGYSSQVLAAGDSPVPIYFYGVQQSDTSPTPPPATSPTPPSATSPTPPPATSSP